MTTHASPDGTPAAVSVDTYPMPAHGWTCFHCGETFKTPGCARQHFGETPDRQPGCVIKVELGGERGLLAALRKAEDELARYRAEDSDTQRELVSLQFRHSEALRAAEEAGYARGLRDAVKMAKTLPPLSAGEIYERREDMSPEGKLQIFFQNDGDVVVRIMARPHDTWETASVEFCSCGSGGGRSPKVLGALRDLARAIVADNQDAPFPKGI